MTCEFLGFHFQLGFPVKYDHRVQLDAFLVEPLFSLMSSSSERAMVRSEPAWLKASHGSRADRSNVALGT